MNSLLKLLSLFLELDDVINKSQSSKDLVTRLNLLIKSCTSDDSNLELKKDE